MIRLIAILTILSFAGCASLRKSSGSKDTFEGYGTNINTADSSLRKEIQLVRFGKHTGVVFPAKYCVNDFGKRGWASDKIFFTPDTNMIKHVDSEMYKQYYNADRQYIAKYYFRVNLDSLNIDSIQEKKYIRNKEAINNWSNFGYTGWKKSSPNYDKQYIGYTDSNNDKFILIKLLDFSQDPYKLKPYFETSWIDGWHGWFYSNVKMLEFNVSKNVLIVNDM